MKHLLRLVFRGLRKCLKHMGYEIRKLPRPESGRSNNRDQLNLNVSAGSYVIPGFESLDLYTPHYYKSREDFLTNRTEYDLRKDSIPFDDASVDNIYISHAIEHVEDNAVRRFISESYRVLKKGGVLRIACPDAEFLHAVSLFDNDYWDWRIRTLSKKTRYDTDWSSCCQYDFMLRELATPRMRFYKSRLPERVISPSRVKSLDYQQLTEALRADLEFREDSPGDHINNWDYSRLSKLAKEAGFEHTIRSKYRGSVSKAMQGPHFDKTYPHMSLYFEAVK